MTNRRERAIRLALARGIASRTRRCVENAFSATGPKIRTPKDPKTK